MLRETNSFHKTQFETSTFYLLREESMEKCGVGGCVGSW